MTHSISPRRGALAGAWASTAAASVPENSTRLIASSPSESPRMPATRGQIASSRKISAQWPGCWTDTST